MVICEGLSPTTLPEKEKIVTEYQNNKHRPAETLRDGNIKATIWRNFGEKGAYYRTQFSRSYKDLNGNYHETSTFNGADILKIGRLAERAYDIEQKLRQQDREAQKEQQS
jgi:hypothetical protein